MGSTTTASPETPASVIDSGGPDHILDFVIPQGATGPAGAEGAQGETGPEGPTGPTGAAATITIGSVTTGDPGTEAQVNNSGTDENAVLDFVIPRGEPGGGGGTLDVLATVDTTIQSPAAGSALVFSDTPLVSGAAITHQPGSTDVQISQPGIYQAVFQSTVSVDAGTSIPASVLVRLTLNGVPVPGATARHTFASTNEVTTMSFDVPFRVDAPPTALEVVVDDAGFGFQDSTLTVIRLGDAS